MSADDLNAWSDERIEEYRRFLERLGVRLNFDVPQPPALERNWQIVKVLSSQDALVPDDVEAAGNAYHYPGALLWRTADNVAHLGNFVWLRTNNNGAPRVGDECIAVQQDYFRGDAVFWLLNCIGTTGESHCFETSFCTFDTHQIETISLCPNDEIRVLNIETDPDCGCEPDEEVCPDPESECGETCDATSFLISPYALISNGSPLTPRGGLPLTGPGVNTGSYTVPASCLPVDHYCLSRTTSYDAGHGITCQKWEGSTSLGTITLTQCGQVWCVAGVLAGGDPENPDVFNCGPVQNQDLCSVPGIGGLLLVLFGNPPPGVGQLGVTITAGECGPKCWQNNSTGHKYCSGANESGTSTSLGSYADLEACDAACFDWACWQSNSLTPTDPGYRYCSNTDDSATATRIATYLTEPACTPVCNAWWCIEWLDCDDAACSVNCHPTTTVLDFSGNVVDYTFCTTLDVVLGGCFSNGVGGYTHYQIVDGPYDHSDCDGNCPPIGGGP